MAYKCAWSGEYVCSFSCDGALGDDGDDCPYNKYQDTGSVIRAATGRRIIDDWCIYYGIKNYKELRKGALNHGRDG